MRLDEVFGGRTRSGALCVLAWTALILLAGGAEAQAQSDGRKIEVGAQFSWLHRSERNAGPTYTLTEDPCTSSQTSLTPSNSLQSAGFGGRVGYNFSDHIIVEGEFNYFPRQPKPLQLYFCPGPGFGTIGADGRISSGLGGLLGSTTSDGHKVEAVFGLKAGGQVENFGLFAKVRPGLVYFSQVVEGGAETNFATDLGGVIEYYPSRRTLIRLDISDLIIRFGERRSITSASLSDFLVSAQANAAPTVFVQRQGQTTHNFRLGVGFGFRF